MFNQQRVKEAPGDGCQMIKERIHLEKPTLNGALIINLITGDGDVGTKSANVLLLVFPLPLKHCLIAHMTNCIDALVLVKADRNGILTILTITKSHHVGPVASNTIPGKYKFFLCTV